VVHAKRIRGRGCSGRLGAWSQRGATRWQGAGEGPGQRLQAVDDRHRPESGGHGPVCGAGGAAAKIGEGGAPDGWPPHTTV
jgi:hypothetical protein